MAYTGPIYRGVDYSPTWPGWSPDASGMQTSDSDLANDAFASLWGKQYQPAPAGDLSVPKDNGGNYRNDLGTIASDGFNLVRLYNWGPARGTSPADDLKGLDHINFLNYAKTLGLKIIVPVSDFFLNDTKFSWNHAPAGNDYSFGAAPAAIQQDFKQFIASITDPTTGKIHASVHSIAVGNEGDIGEGIKDNGGTSASDFLYRTNWWIVNLNKQINGTSGNGPDGLPVVNNPTTIPISATFANADQGSFISSWFKALVDGVTAGQATPNVWVPNGTTTFTATVQGLAAADPGFEKYYYNSFNIGQASTAAPFGNSIAETLAKYDSGASPWPGKNFNVPLLLMEVFTPDRNAIDGNTKLPVWPTPADQVTAAINEAKTIEAYLKDHQAGTAGSTTNLMGYNYFQFNDEPHANKMIGLYQYPGASTPAQTGTTSVFFDPLNNGVHAFADASFPVFQLTPTLGPDGKALWQGWTAAFNPSVQGTAANDVLAGAALVDLIQGAAGNDSIDGGAGYDTALYGQAANGYALRATAGSPAITVQDKIGTEGTDTLTNVENVRFTDQTLPTSWLSATAALPASQILKVVDLYTAGLGRAPDAIGLNYWGSRLAEGAKLSDISQAIFGSPEAAATYSPLNSNQTFVNLVYGTALGRTPDAAGLAYWTNELATGHLARTDLVTALIEGARGLGGNGGSGGLGADAQYVANREFVGAHFALTDGLNNTAWAQAVVSGVTAAAGSVTAANAQSDAFAMTAATAATSELVVQILGVVP
jgi:hypothetical protein